MNDDVIPDSHALIDVVSMSAAHSTGIRSIHPCASCNTIQWLVFCPGWQQVPASEICWESVTGLRNKGRVTFENIGREKCLMTLTLSYNLPYVRRRSPGYPGRHCFRLGLSLAIIAVVRRMTLVCRPISSPRHATVQCHSCP